MSEEASTSSPAFAVKNGNNTDQHDDDDHVTEKAVAKTNKEESVDETPLIVVQEETSDTDSDRKPIEKPHVVEGDLLDFGADFGNASGSSESNQEWKNDWDMFLDSKTSSD